MSKYCGYCGAENEDNAKFCGNCSKPFDDVKVKSNKKRYIAFLAGIVAVVAVVFVAFNLLFGQQKSILQADDGGFLTSEDSLQYLYTNSATVLGSSYKRSSIDSITFLDKKDVDEIPDSAWDVSEKQNESVMAWVEEIDDDLYDLYIAGKGGVYANEDSSYLFAGYDCLQEINFNDCFYTNKVTDMSYMFCGFSNFATLDLSSFDTSNVANMNGMFFASYIESLDLTSFDTSKVTDMGFMFSDCYSLRYANLSSFDTSSVTNMCSMFYQCSCLESLDISNFDTSNVTDMSYMFGFCSCLDNLDTDAFDTSNADITSMYIGTDYNTYSNSYKNDTYFISEDVANQMIDYCDNVMANSYSNTSVRTYTITTAGMYLSDTDSEYKDVYIVYRISQKASGDIVVGFGSWYEYILIENVDSSSFDSSQHNMTKHYLMKSNGIVSDTTLSSSEVMSCLQEEYDDYEILQY